MALHRVLRCATATLLAAGVTLLSEGCVTFSVEQTGPEKGSASRPTSLRVSVYESRAAAKKADVFAGTVRSKLLRLEPLPEEAVFESSEASWLIADLQPGKYSLEVSQRAGPEPGSAEVRHGKDRFRVKAGEEASAVVILHDTRAWTWAGVGVGIGAVVVVGALILVGVLSLGTKGLSMTFTEKESRPAPAGAHPVKAFDE